MPRYVCLRCGRNKFTQKQAHYCRGQYVKRFGRVARLMGVPDLFVEIDDDLIEEKDDGQNIERVRDVSERRIN